MMTTQSNFTALLSVHLVQPRTYSRPSASLHLSGLQLSMAGDTAAQNGKPVEDPSAKTNGKHKAEGTALLVRYEP